MQGVRWKKFGSWHKWSTTSCLNVSSADLLPDISEC